MFGIGPDSIESAAMNPIAPAKNANAITIGIASLADPVGRKGCSNARSDTGRDRPAGSPCR
jgi:hypothetical protein